MHTFHGNFFVRSTDLLSLPNVNPDAGFGMQVSIEGKFISTYNPHSKPFRYFITDPAYLNLPLR